MDVYVSVLLKSFSAISIIQKNNSIHRSYKLKSIGFSPNFTKYTVLRSPHIDKKSREQWKTSEYKHLFEIRIPAELLKEKIRLLSDHPIQGVQIKVSFQIKNKTSFNYNSKNL